MILFNGKINILLFIEILCFSINRMLCLLFLHVKCIVNSTIHKTFEKTQKKRVSTQKHNKSLSLKRV